MSAKKNDELHPFFESVLFVKLKENACDRSHLRQLIDTIRQYSPEERKKIRSQIGRVPCPAELRKGLETVLNIIGPN